MLLDEIREGGVANEKRYRAALDGVSLGTHSTGSTAGAVAIRRAEQGSSDGGSSSSKDS